jgi:hypothetical protein
VLGGDLLQEGKVRCLGEPADGVIVRTEVEARTRRMCEREIGVEKLTISQKCTDRGRTDLHSSSSNARIPGGAVC